MEKRTRVVVCGRSLNMAGIAAGLKAEASLEVVGVDSDSSTVRQCLNDLNPAVIVFDLSDPSLDLDITLLRERPGLQLIHVHPASDEVLVLSSRSEQVLSVADLLHVIAHRDRNTNHIGEASSEG